MDEFFSWAIPVVGLVVLLLGIFALLLWSLPRR